jgi:hypothetical protein
LIQGLVGHHPIWLVCPFLQVRRTLRQFELMHTLLCIKQGHILPHLEDIQHQQISPPLQMMIFHPLSHRPLHLLQEIPPFWSGRISLGRIPPALLLLKSNSKTEWHEGPQTVLQNSRTKSKMMKIRSTNACIWTASPQLWVSQMQIGPPLMHLKSNSFAK